jgi:death-on-curing protein
MTKFLTAEQVLYLHDRLIRETGGSHGVRELSGLLSAVGRPGASFEGQGLYPDVFHQAAALMESLVRNHPFVDGNKRTGAAAAVLFLRANGYALSSEQEELVNKVLQVAVGELDVVQLADWPRAHSRPLSAARPVHPDD